MPKNKTNEPTVKKSAESIELQRLRSQVEKLTRNILSLTDENAALQKEFNSIKPSTESESELETLRVENRELKTQIEANTNEIITSLTRERDAATQSLATARTNLSRLEALAGVKGIDPKAAPAASSENPYASNHVFDQWMNATGEEKMSLFRSHKAEIRAEASRRGTKISSGDRQ